MGMLAIKSFGGVSPRTPPRYLQDGQAQVAINCPAFSGSLMPLQDAGDAVHTLTKTVNPGTVYRFGQAIKSDTLYWFHWEEDVDVAKGPIANDTSERTYFTGLSEPRVTDLTLAVTQGQDGAYPFAWYKLGVPAPQSALIPSVTGTPEANATPEDRVYTYCYVNGWGDVSAPGAPSGTPAGTPITVTFGESVVLTNFVAPPSGYNITTVRIYRSTAGIYLFVADVPLATALADGYTDSIAAADLGEELPSLTWLEPPATLTGLVSGPNGMMAGFTGNDIYFCEPFRPYAWPVDYSQTVDYPAVGIGVMDTTFAVLTTGVPYFIQGSHPDSMAVVKSDIEQACVAKRSIVSFGGTVVYASPDGLVMLSSGGSKLITEMMFTRVQWQQLKPESMHAYQHDRKYVCFYDTGTTQGGFIFDYTTGVFVFHDIYAESAFHDMQNDELYIALADRTIRKWATGALKTFSWRSKKFTLPQITGFSCAQVEAEGYPITAKFYMDGALVHTETVASRTPFRLPAIKGRDVEVELTGNTEVFALLVAQSMEEIASA